MTDQKSAWFGDTERAEREAAGVVEPLRRTIAIITKQNQVTVAALTAVANARYRHVGGDICPSCGVPSPCPTLRDLNQLQAPELSVAELDNLPIGSIVTGPSGLGALQKFGSGWFPPGHPLPYTADELAGAAPYRLILVGTA